MRTTKSSTSLSIVGQPGALRYWEPSNFWATSLRCQPRIVSGLTILATSCRACFPNLWPISASVLRSPSLNRTRPLSWLRRIRFPVFEFFDHTGCLAGEIAVGYPTRRHPPVCQTLCCRYNDMACVVRRLEDEL